MVGIIFEGIVVVGIIFAISPSSKLWFFVEILGASSRTASYLRLLLIRCNQIRNGSGIFPPCISFQFVVTHISNRNIFKLLIIVPVFA